MQRHNLRIEYNSYTVHVTNEFDRSVGETYKRFFGEESEGKKPEGYADKWLGEVSKFVNGLQKPVTLGRIDPKHFSDTYAHHQVSNTETTIFFLVEKDQIYLATSGWSGRNWPEALRAKKPAIDSQIKTLRHQCS